MGIAASQGLLLQLTARNHSIGFELQDLSNQKVRLSSEMQKISRNYQDSLNRKVLKWSNNSGVSYMDLSYANLMKPSAMNKNKAYLLTDPEGRVVVDNQYKKYAEMISPNGAPGGDWEGNRTAILAEITGIDASKIDSANSYQEAIWENDEIIQELMHKEPNKNKFTENNISDLLKKAGSSTGCSATFSSGEDWASAYENSDATISLGAGASAVSNLNGVLDHLSKSLSKYFLDDADKFSQAVEEIRNEYRGLIESNSDQSKSASGLRGNSSEYKINVSTIIDEILGHYGNLGGESTEAEYNGKKQY